MGSDDFHDDREVGRICNPSSKVADGLQIRPTGTDHDIRRQAAGHRHRPAGERSNGTRGFVEAVAEQGLAGDRYGAGIGAAQFKGRRKPENEVTLIAREAIEAANDEFNLTIAHLDTRRNLLTEGVPLNDLVTKTFRVGPCSCGMELCEPCGYLERRTYSGIKACLNTAADCGVQLSKVARSTLAMPCGRGNARS